MTESTTPQLTESDVAQIEARLTRITGVEMANGRHPASWDEVAALIRDWRALQAEIADYEQTDLVPRTRYNAADAEAREARGMVETTADKAKVEIERLETQNAALRDQLAEARQEAQRVSDYIQDQV